MSLFACAIHPQLGHVPESFRRSIASSPFCRDGQIEWYAAHGFLGAVDASDHGPPSCVVRLGQAVAIGTVRLDNRREIVASLRCLSDDASDLALALRFVVQGHGTGIDRLLGDFAFVVWDPARRRVIVARDAFGVRKLFYACLSDDCIAFASRASLLRAGDAYDAEYLIKRIALSDVDPTRTVYRGVSAVPPATVLRVEREQRSFTTYWSAIEAQRGAVVAGTSADQCELFRGLLVDAVRLRVTDSAPVWSQLSGGMDSSSVASLAQWLAQQGEVPHGLAGTVSFTDDLGTSADEKEFSNAVVQRYRLRNEFVAHRAEPSAILADPPVLDQPDRSFAVAFRDRAAASVVRNAGGRVLLTGEGGDALVAGTMFFFADWLISRRAWPCIREMAHRAALGRVSFWRLAYENALLPLLSLHIRHYLTRRRAGSIPRWIPSIVVRRFDLRSHITYDQVYRGRYGRKYADALAWTIGAIPTSMPLGPADDLLDLRHPYLHRPLVELALGLSADLCVQPHMRKWILREAMRGILPEVVRTRVGKGALDGLNTWSLLHEGPRIDRLLREPILGQLGIIDPVILRRVLDAVREGRAPQRDVGAIRLALDVEMWLQLRSGRWAPVDAQSTSTTHVDVA